MVKKVTGGFGPRKASDILKSLRSSGNGYRTSISKLSKEKSDALDMLMGKVKTSGGLNLEEALGKTGAKKVLSKLSPEVLDALKSTIPKLANGATLGKTLGIAGGLADVYSGGKGLIKEKGTKNKLLSAGQLGLGVASLTPLGWEASPVLSTIGGGLELAKDRPIKNQPKANNKKATTAKDVQQQYINNVLSKVQPTASDYSNVYGDVNTNYPRQTQQVFTSNVVPSNRISNILPSNKPVQSTQNTNTTQQVNPNSDQYKQIMDYINLNQQDIDKAKQPVIDSYKNLLANYDEIAKQSERKALVNYALSNITGNQGYGKVAETYNPLNIATDKIGLQGKLAQDIIDRANTMNSMYGNLSAMKSLGLPGGMSFADKDILGTYQNIYGTRENNATRRQGFENNLRIAQLEQQAENQRNAQRINALIQMNANTVSGQRDIGAGHDYTSMLFSPYQFNSQLMKGYNNLSAPDEGYDRSGMSNVDSSGQYIPRQASYMNMRY